jgi:hypothetical protein
MNTDVNLVVQKALFLKELTRKQNMSAVNAVQKKWLKFILRFKPTIRAKATAVALPAHVLLEPALWVSFNIPG